MSKKEIIKVKIINKALALSLGVKVDTSVDVRCRGGVPLEAYWRNRFKDAALTNKKGERIDKSIELSKNVYMNDKKAADPKPSPAPNGGK